MIKKTKIIIIRTSNFLLRIIKRPNHLMEYLKLYLISNTKRYKPSTTRILKNKLFFADSASFVFMYDEIFLKEIYQFKNSSKEVYIIDGGANIGLSAIYFKKKYPNSEIVAFEPDPDIVNFLMKNITSFDLKNVTVVNKGLWNTEGHINFFPEGSDGGRIEPILGHNNKKTTIQTTRLRSYLNKNVDLLKLDIEGAELLVLEDCKDQLVNVKNLFIEYHSFSNNHQCLDRILNIISNSGFRYYIESVGITSKQPFLSRNLSLNMDLQLNFYAYRN